MGLTGVLALFSYALEENYDQATSTRIPVIVLVGLLFGAFGVTVLGQIAPGCNVGNFSSAIGIFKTFAAAFALVVGLHFLLIF